MSAEPVNIPTEAPVAAPIVEETKLVETAPVLPVIEASEDAPALKEEEPSVAPAEESTSAPEEPKAEEAAATPAEETKGDDKKEKKSGKALSGLLAKFRKPAKDEKVADKEVVSPTTVPEEPAAADAAPVDDTESAPTPASPVVDAPAPDDAPAVAAETAPETPKTGATTPTKKEKPGIFDRLAFFKKSPKSKKTELSPDVTKAEENVEGGHGPAEASGETATEDAKVSEAPAVESVVPAAADAPAPVDDAPKEDAGAHKKPKDLTKLARRLSGRLFGAVGADKKAEKSVKAGEVTKEEEEPSTSGAPTETKSEEPVAPALPEVPASVPEATTDAPVVSEEASLVPCVENTVETTPAITATA